MTLPVVTLQGRLGADPELRFTPAGLAVCSLRLVANDRKKQDDGTWVDGDPLWITATVWRQMAENAANTLTKGDLVIVTGKIKQETYETPDGQTRTVMKLDAFDVGPSLRYVEAEIKRIDRRTTSEGPPATGPASAGTDPWGTPPKQPDIPPF